MTDQEKINKLEKDVGNLKHYLLMIIKEHRLHWHNGNHVGPNSGQYLEISAKRDLE